MNTKNSIAFVTGANRGIGEALVAELLARGASRVYAAARDPKSLEAAVAKDRRVVPVRLDVTNESDVAKLGENARDAQLLFNNAGLLGAASLLTTPREVVQRDLDTNFFGSLAVARALLPALERAAENEGRAAIVNVLTVVSLASMPALGGYSASKAAAYSMTQALRAELASRKIDVHAVFPGPVDTDMAREITLPKTSPQMVARAILDGVERGEEDIGPDAMSAQVLSTWRSSPKEVERMFASL